MMMNKNKRMIILISIFWFAIIAFLSYRMPMVNDDYLHSTSFATGEDITSVGMIPSSVATYYMTWGGRALSMVFIQLMLMLPRWVYAICNAVIYVIACRLICAYTRRENDPVIFALLCLFVWFFVPDFAEVTTWLTGNVTYLWTTTLILLMGLIYYRDYKTAGADTEAITDSKATDVPAWKRILPFVGIIILGFCAGLSNEAGSCTLILVLMAYAIWSFKTHRRIPVDRIAGMIAVIAGTAVLLLAPGNRIRAGVAGAEAEHGSIVKIFAFRIARESFYTLLYLLVPFVICLALFLFRTYRQSTLEAARGSQTESATHATLGGVLLNSLKDLAEPAFWLLAFVSIYVLTFSSGFADRIFQFPTFMLGISFVISISKLVSNGAESETDSADTEAASPAGSVSLRGVLAALIVGLMLTVLVEIVAGVLYSGQAGTYFDRRMHYYHIEEELNSGLMPGNGMSE